MGDPKKSIVAGKSMDFAVRIVNLYRHLTEAKSERVMSKQLLRSGTSIGANVFEALEGISDRDFLAKLYISLKESRETSYWLELLHRTDYLTDSEYNSISADCTELCKLLTAITKTLSQKLKK